MTASNDQPRFDTDIKPLFREQDREMMEFAFDLWDYDDVQENAGDILKQVETGRMPCDTKWSEQQIGLFRQWTEAGRPR